jgi:hypothetical protein
MLDFFRSLPKSSTAYNEADYQHLVHDKLEIEFEKNTPQNPDANQYLVVGDFTQNRGVYVYSMDGQNALGMIRVHFTQKKPGNNEYSITGYSKQQKNQVIKNLLPITEVIIKKHALETGGTGSSLIISKITIPNSESFFSLRGKIINMFRQLSYLESPIIEGHFTKKI